MRHQLLNKEFERGNYFTYGMPEMNEFLQLRKGYDHSKHYDDSANSATIIFYKLFMPCCGTFANYADKHHKEYLSEIYSPSQEGYVLIELENNYDKWSEKAIDLYKRNDDKDKEETCEQEVEDGEKHEVTEETEEKKTAQGTLYTNSRYCVSMDGWSEAGIRKYNSLCRLAEEDRRGEHCKLFESLFKKEESEARFVKEEPVFNEEEFIQPYNNLMNDSSDEDSDDDSSDDDDDNDEEKMEEEHNVNGKEGNKNDLLQNSELFDDGEKNDGVGRLAVGRKCAV